MLNPGPITRERVENALNILADVLARRSPEDAARAAPIYERLERELAAIDAANDVRLRARMRLAALSASEQTDAPKSPAKPARRRLRRMPVVYFVQSGDRIKIGRSENWEGRLPKIETDSPYAAIPLLVLPADAGIERLLHNHFDKFRVKGEWFSYCREIISFIKRAQDEVPPVGGIPVK